MRYTYDELKETYDSLMKKAQDGEKLTDFEIQLGRGTGHAIDAMDLSKDIQHPLDLTKSTESEVATALLSFYYHYAANDKSSSECKKLISQKIGFYLIFETVNSLIGDGYDAEVVLAGNQLMVAVKGGSDNINTKIDILTLVERFVLENVRFDVKEKNMVITDPERLLKNIRSQI